MSMYPFKELDRLKYVSVNFNLRVTQAVGAALWDFIKRPDNVVRMHTASDLERAAVEPLSAGLVAEFGPEVAEDRTKQMIGRMVRQIMGGHRLRTRTSWFEDCPQWTVHERSQVSARRQKRRPQDGADHAGAAAGMGGADSEKPIRPVARSAGSWRRRKSRSRQAVLGCP